MQDEIRVKKEEILKKKFRKNLIAGYDAYEVDKFFDSVINFLNYIENEIISLENIKNKLINENEAMNKNLEKANKNKIFLEHELRELKEDGYHNQKIIKDISTLKSNYEKMKNGNK